MNPIGAAASYGSNGIVACVQSFRQAIPLAREDVTVDCHHITVGGAIDASYRYHGMLRELDTSQARVRLVAGANPFALDRGDGRGCELLSFSGGAFVASTGPVFCHELGGTAQ